MTHRKYQPWTADEDQILRRFASAGARNKEIALAIGRTTYAVNTRMNFLGVTRGRDLCGFCRTPLGTLQPTVGRQRLYCSDWCHQQLIGAYERNASIDNRPTFACLHCGAPLPAGSNTQSRWCSPACGKRDWHERNKNNPARREAQYASKRRMVARQRGVS